MPKQHLPLPKHWVELGPARGPSNCRCYFKPAQPCLITCSGGLLTKAW